MSLEAVKTVKICLNALMIALLFSANLFFQDSIIAFIFDTIAAGFMSTWLFIAYSYLVNAPAVLSLSLVFDLKIALTLALYPLIYALICLFIGRKFWRKIVAERIGSVLGM